MPLLSEVNNIIQNIFYLYDDTGFTQLWHLIPVATKCMMPGGGIDGSHPATYTQDWT